MKTDVYETISARKTIRDFEQREIAMDVVRRLLDAGLRAPSHNHLREWQFVILQPETLSSLNAFASIWCCNENVLIAAAAEGIFGVTRIPSEAERETIKRFLNVPEDHEIPCWLALGYPKSTAARTRQIQVLVDERMHINAY